MPFCAKSLAPAANASVMACRSLRPVSIRIGGSRPPAWARIARQASMPERFGIITSRTTRSGLTSGNRRKASAPSAAVCTMKPAPASAASASIRCDGSSSAISRVVVVLSFMRGAFL